MANTIGDVIITPESLNKSFEKFREDLITMPVYGLSKILPYVTLRPGVRYKETVGELSGDMQLAPFNPMASDTNDMKVEGRTLETFLGNAVKSFNPNSVVNSIYGSEIVQGEGLKNVPMTKKVWAYLLSRLGGHIYDSIFTAARSDEGTTTAELFNGFCTIADAEKLATKISTEKGNYFKLTEEVTALNAYKSIDNIYSAANEHLKDEETMILMNPQTKRNYEKDYQTTNGSLPYNNEFKKTYIDGSGDRCELVGLSCMPAGKFIMTTKSNLLLGLATKGEGVTFECKPSLKSHFLIDFVASMFVGCQFESINPEKLLYSTVEVL